MPRKPRQRVQCQYFSWNVFERDGVAYADGRSNTPNLGKNSLGVRAADAEAVTTALNALDFAKAVELGRATATVTSAASANMLISDGWDQYMEHCQRPGVLGGVGAATVKRYKAVRDKHQAYCGNHSIKTWYQVDQGHVEAYGKWLSRQGYQDATLYLECTLLVQIVKWMIINKLLPESHRFVMSMRRSHESFTYCYSRGEVGAIVEYCRRTNGLTWLAQVVVALATTGMRIGELVNLRWSDVDFDAGFIRVTDNRHSGRHGGAAARQTTKGRRSRRIPIHAGLRAELQQLPRGTDGRVFHGPRGGNLKADTVRNILVRDVLEPLKEKFPTAAGDIGFEHGRVHSFRHFFVSQAFLSGASEGEIREWVGHADSRIVERYRHLRDEDAHRKMQSIDFFAVKPNDAGDDRGNNDAVELVTVGAAEHDN